MAGSVAVISLCGLRLGLASRLGIAACLGVRFHRSCRRIETGNLVAGLAPLDRASCAGANAFVF